MEIILLVGTTGAGKSTLFNFLSGADFKIQDRELQLRNPSKHFSEMKGGMHSVTKEPKYYYNSEFNHLLIDFPGFQDTDGELDQLLMELLFQRVVTLLPIKVVYVIKNNESTLPNRGIQIIEFADQLFKNSNLNVNKFNLLLNCYLEDLSDDELRRNIRRELTQANRSNFIDNILIIRKVQNAGDLNNYFTAEKKYEQWQQLRQIKSIQLKPKSIPRSEIISQYLRQSIQGITDEYDGIINRNVNKCCNEMNNPKSVEQITQTQSLIDKIIKEKIQDTTQWYTTFIENCQKIPGDHKENQNFNNFKKILHYCSQFSNQIEKYSDVISSIKRTQMQFQTLKKNLEEKCQNQEEKIKLKSNIEKLETQGEQVKAQLNQQISNNKNLEQQMNRLNDQNSSLRAQMDMQKYSNHRLERQMDRQQEQNDKLRQQIEEQKKEHTKIYLESIKQQRENQEYRQESQKNQAQIQNLERQIHKQREEIEEKMKCFRKLPIRRRR